MIKVSKSFQEDIILMLTKDDVVACANELGIPKEQVPGDVIELVERRLNLEFRHWPDIVKNLLKESARCPLGLVCYPSCFWWKDGRCSYQERISQEPKITEKEILGK